MTRPSQLTLDLPGLWLPAELSALTPRRPRSAVPGEPAWTGGDEVGAVPRLLPTRHTDLDGPGVGARVPVRVYAEESVARGDAAVLRRDAVRAGHRVRTVDCLPLRVFTESQHGHR